jgi:hypothetical protein
MKHSSWTSFAMAVVAAAGVAAACGGHSAGFGGAPGEDGGGSGSSTGGGSNGGSSGTSGSSGGLTLGSSSSGASGGSTSGGTTTGCDASCGAAGGTCSGTKCTLSENPGNVSMSTQMQLQATGNADSAFKWLYPYDKTVFPKGLLSPTLQFAGGASDAEYVHITSNTLDYKGYFAGGAANQVTLSLSDKAWTAVMAAVGAGDSAHVSVTKISGSSVSGPISESWPVAQGNIRGTIYYETYGSTIAGGLDSVAIMKIDPGAKQPTTLKSGCGNVCHAASADGSTLVAATGVLSSASYNLSNNAATLYAPSSILFAYGGLYPDGSFLMNATGFRLATSLTSSLYDTKTGASITSTGWNNMAGGTPAFSPDGKQIAFIHNAHAIGKMDFAVSSKAFSGLVDLASDPNLYLAWPAFTPDGKVVLYQSGSSNAYETDCQNTGDLFAVDVATHTVRRLDVLDGYTGSGTASYLPANDPGLNFAPTMLSEAVGGYYWAIFTSHRSYGSKLGSKANSTAPLTVGTCPNMAGDEANGKLWVAAIDINPQAGQDPSHPAFYLDGQELQADNLRGYWVLPPCASTGKSCMSGDECCTGFCRSAGNDQAPACVTQPVGCSNEFERCTKASDCCVATDQCINNRCASPAAPQ